MARLPLELLDNIVSLALAVGTLSINDATLICYHWKPTYQKLLFKSVKVDPFSDNILDLADPLHAHLVPYIRELRVVRRSDSPSPRDPPDYNRDLAEAFTSFLRNARSVVSMIFLDARIQWKKVSPETIGAFRAVFERPSFRSLEVSVGKPLPPWMLLYGGCVASDLTVRCIGAFELPPLSAEPVKYQCCLTRLALFGNSSVREIAQFCMQQRALADDLLRNVVDLVVECTETPAWRSPPITPYAELMVAFLAPQLEILDLRVGSSDTPPSSISATAVRDLKALQHLTIHLTGPPLWGLPGRNNTIASAKEYMQSLLAHLPFPSPMRSLSLAIDDQTGGNSGVEGYGSSYSDLLNSIVPQLSCPRKLPCLNSTSILINVTDDSFAETLCIRNRKTFHTMNLTILSSLRVNLSKVDNFGGSVIPLMG